MEAPSRPRNQSSLPLSIVLALLAALAVLALHIRHYWFTTDDAFIAFRYARNLSQGHGLVFNAGFERVEGFTSLLWVLLLAGLDRVGIRPEHAANVLGAVAGVATWWAVIRFWIRPAERGAQAWRVLLPAWGLALNRSFAVWASGGLETRMFEAFVAIATLRLVWEQRERDQGRSPAAVSMWVYAVACVTRPEGVLVAAMAATATGIWQALGGRLSTARFVREWAPVAGTVLALTLFRLAYYQDWLPNTWYAKSGGEIFVGVGLRYLTAFAIEYAGWLWIPFLIAALTRRAWAREGFLLLTVSLIVGAEICYVVAIGGDHFEYRPLGMVVLLAYAALPALLDAETLSKGRRTAAIALAVLAIAASTIIPWESHRQFPPDYRTGFPGARLQDPMAQSYLEPARSPLTNLPGLRALMEVYRRCLRELTANLVAIRQEEHKLFLEGVLPDGQELQRLVDLGLLPKDAYIALDCVGAIPYYSGLRTLDRLGLTDAHVARSARAGNLLAHWRFATLQYARGRGVDLWAEDRVHLTCGLDSRSMDRVRRQPMSSDTVFVAEVTEGRFLLCQLPFGRDGASRRMPRLRFVPFQDSAFLASYLPRLASAWRDSLALHPDDGERREQLVELLISVGDFQGAIPVLEGIVARGVATPRTLELLAYCQHELGLSGAARLTLRRALSEAARTGDTDLIQRWEAMLKRPK